MPATKEKAGSLRTGYADSSNNMSVISDLSRDSFINVWRAKTNNSVLMNERE